MTRQLLAAAVVMGWAGSAAAQVSPGYPQYGSQPSANPYGFGPTNPYNRTNQPLSPYLNLLRGGNPAVNYAYGVRPGTSGGGGFGGGAPMVAQGGMRAPYFPLQQFAQQQDSPDLPTPGEGYKLPPAGHPVLYNNTLGYFPSPFAQRGAPGRTGLTGAGAGASGSRPTGSGTTRR